MVKKAVKIFKKHWLIALFLLVVFLRLPSLFEPFTYGDEGIYLTLGQAARQGLVFYRDIHDNKPPLLYLFAGFAESFSAYRLILFFWSLATIFLFYLLSKSLFKKNFFAIIASTTVFALFTSLHTFEGNVANAENFMLLPTIGAFYWVFNAQTFLGKKEGWLENIKIWLLPGVLLGVATLFKVPAAFDFAALLVFSSFLFLEQKISSKQHLLRYTLLIIGFILPLLATFLYYAFQGALNEYLAAAFFQNIPYLSSWAGGQAQVGGLPFLLLVRSGILALLIIVLLVLRKKVSLRAKLILIWFAFSWYAALLSSRPYPHYLIQLLPAFSLSLGLLFTTQKQYLFEKIIPAILFIAFVLTFNLFNFWTYKNLPYYRNFYQFALGNKNLQEYFADYDGRANDVYQVADYLVSHTLADEEIFIWGNIPFVYSLARRLPTGRYAVAYHIIDFNGYEETMIQIQDKPPRFIILDLEEKRPFPEFFSWLERNYTLIEQIGDFQIYHQLL